MTAANSTISTLLVAIDISKHRHEVLIGVPGKTRRRRLTITNTLECLAPFVWASKSACLQNGFWHRRSHAEGMMRPDMVVLPEPGIDCGVAPVADIVLAVPD